MRVSFRYLVAVLTVVGVLPVTAQTTEVKIVGENVDSLLAIARERHPELLAMRDDVAAAAERIGPAGALPDPMFGVELRDFTNQGGVNESSGPNLLPARVGATRYTVTQGLPWFGKRDLKRSIAEAEHETAQGLASATWADLAWQIKQTFAQHYLHSVSLQFGRENLELLAQLEKIAQVRYANGAGAQQDAIRAQTERTALKSELIQMQSEHEQAIVRLHTLVGRPVHFHLAPKQTLRPMPAPAQLEFRELMARLVARNPTLVADKWRIIAAERNRDLTLRNRYPDVNVGLAAMQERNRVNSYDLMFEVNIPLQQESRRAQEREAERRVDAATARHEAARNQALAEMDVSLNALQSARRIETVLNDSLLPQAELTLQAALAGYESGKVDFSTVLDAQRQIRKSKEDLAKARVTQQMRLADIERAIGEEL